MVYPVVVCSIDIFSVVVYVACPCMFGSRIMEWDANIQRTAVRCSTNAISDVAIVYC
jgi:hypothetical protein